MQIKLQFEVLQLPRCLLAQGVVVITVLDVGMELLQRLLVDGLVLWVAVEEVGMNGPVKGYQGSLRLWGCQLP